MASIAELIQREKLPRPTQSISNYPNLFDGTETEAFASGYITRAHHGDEIPERDVTYHLTCLLIYHGTTTHL